MGWSGADRCRVRLRCEQLESRETPATLVAPWRVTYQDVDGDFVSVTFSKAILNAGNVNTIFTFNTGSVNGSNATKQQLQRIDLTSLGAAAAGVNITTFATSSKITGGNGSADLGEILASGLDLGNVLIDGDLGRIVAGDTKLTTPGLQKLAADSLGKQGLTTGAANLNSVIQGPVGQIQIKNSVSGASIDVQGAGAKIGSVTIGQKLQGDANNNSGMIRAAGNIGFVTIGDSVIGGAGADSGRIVAGGDLGPVSIGNDLQGGAGAGSGVLEAGGRLIGVRLVGSLEGGGGNGSGRIVSQGDMGWVNILGDVVGGVGTNSGVVESEMTIAGVRIGGSILGGSGSGSGRISSDLSMGTIAIGKNLIGGSASGSADLTLSGAIVSGGRIHQITIGQSFISGTNNTTGIFLDNGLISARQEIGSILVGKNIQGQNNSLAVIRAGGFVEPTALSSVSIGTLIVRGNVDWGLVLAGWDTNGNPTNADAQIGTIFVAGHWTASTVAAGAVSTNGWFGDADDTKISGIGVKDEPHIISKINSIVIGGQVTGTPAAGDHFGFVAQQVGFVKVGGSIIPTTFGPGNDNTLVGTSNDVRIREIS